MDYKECYTKCLFVDKAKLIKARKEHQCCSCGNTIDKGRLYWNASTAQYIPYYDDDNDYTGERKCERHYEQYKFCFKCNVKKMMSWYRADRRKENCPDERFEYVWQGGWCGGEHACPDGGDVELECHACNLHCL